MTEALKEGDPAPDFDLPTDSGGQVQLEALRGRPVVIYFYPKDDTSGCTKEALAFTELKPEFDSMGAVVIGISQDSVTSHDKFKAKHALTITLASDESREALEKYGVWVEKSMYGRKYMGIERSTFLVARDGTIARIWRRIKLPGHALGVLNAARLL